SLKFLHICKRELLTRSLRLLQNLLDSLGPVDGIPLKANFVGISLRRHAIVGRRHKSFCWVERVRQLVNRHKTGPLEAPVSWHRNWRAMHMHCLPSARKCVTQPVRECMVRDGPSLLVRAAIAWTGADSHNVPLGKLRLTLRAQS